jgi:hypothetical protein
MAAFSLISLLGAHIRRQRSELGAFKAITATAHKPARLVYSMLNNGTSYADFGQDNYEERYRSRVVQDLKGKALHLGFELITFQS